MMRDKIALEEHYLSEGQLDEGHRAIDANIVKRLLDTEDLRLEAMDRNGIATSVLSHSITGVQAEPDPGRAAALARELNDGLAELVARHPSRFAAFAAIPMHDGDSAAAELRRAVADLGFLGAHLNGFQNVSGSGFTVTEALYYDDPRFEPFWAAAVDLSVPVYLHPRFAPTDQQRIYEGYRAMASAAWGFGVETGGHALRLIVSGVFERHPQLTMILGHLGEMLPYAIGRFDQCWARDARGPQSEAISQPPSHYFHRNFHVTTSGFFHTRALEAAIAELGVDRVMFSVDYPYENPDAGAAWFDALPLDPADRARISARATPPASCASPEPHRGRPSGWVLVPATLARSQQTPRRLPRELELRSPR
ncbi:MAG TPA: amidohydrolase family protein [Actinomycetota bacterium]